jgi:hypothetical protein
MVWEVRKVVNVSIINTDGIICVEDALEIFWLVNAIQTGSQF